MTTEVATAPSWLERKQSIVAYVSGKVGTIQSQYRSKEASRVALGAEKLARLRRGVGREPGELPDLWSIIDAGELGEQHGSDATATEWAVHVPVTLYAMHQQSVADKDMHQNGFGLGSAIAHLERASGNETAVHRRFTAAATALDLPELVVHIRGLIGQLRQHRIALDYGRLAGDLFAWQSPRATAGVRRGWGRDLHATRYRNDREDKNNGNDPKEAS